MTAAARTRRRLAGVLVVALAAAATGHARAQPDPDTPPSPADVAIQKGREGVEHFERAEWSAALRLFREAEAAYHSPVLQLFEARSLERLGRLVEADAVYAAVLREPIPDTAPAPWHQAQSDAAKERRALSASMPHLSVLVEGQTPATRVTVNGEPITTGARLSRDPGTYRVVVTDGVRKIERTVVLHRGDSEKTLRLSLPRPVVVPDGPTEAPLDPFRVLGVVLTSLGGASLAAGAVMGGLAVDRASEAAAKQPPECTPQGSCPAFVDVDVIEAEYASAYTYASAADGLLIGGGVLAAAGVLVLILDPGGAPAAVAPKKGGGAIVLRF